MKMIVKHSYVSMGRFLNLLILTSIIYFIILFNCYDNKTRINMYNISELRVEFFYHFWLILAQCALGWPWISTLCLSESCFDAVRKHYSAAREKTLTWGVVKCITLSGQGGTSGQYWSASSSKALMDYVSEGQTVDWRAVQSPPSTSSMAEPSHS